MLDQVDLFGEFSDGVDHLILVNLDLAEQLDYGPHELCVLAYLEQLELRKQALVLVLQHLIPQGDGQIVN